MIKASQISCFFFLFHRYLLLFFQRKKNSGLISSQGCRRVRILGASIINSMKCLKIMKLLGGIRPPAPRLLQACNLLMFYTWLVVACIKKDLLINIIVLANLFYKILFHVVNQWWWNRMGNGLRGIYSSNFCMIYFSRPPLYFTGNLQLETHGKWP